MADLSVSHRSALSSLVSLQDDGRWKRFDAVTSAVIRNRMGWISYSAREVRSVMRRLQQAGLVELAVPTLAGSYSQWRITDAGVTALGLEGVAHG